MEKPNDLNGTSRRWFLNTFLGGSLTAWLGAILYPLYAYLRPPAQAEANISAVKVDAVDQFPADSGRIVPFGRKPALVIRLGADASSNGFRAFIATCSHLDCTVQYQKDKKAIFCACHNGLYDLNGKNIAGPPPRPLNPLRVNVREGTVYISKETA